MADKWPLADGNWSDATNWNGGTKPVAGDDVYADGRTVTIDEDVTVATVRNEQRSGGTIGGTFVLTDGITVTADVRTPSSAVTCVTSTLDSPAEATIVGTIFQAASFATSLLHTGSGLITILGNLNGMGNNQSTGVWINGPGSLVVTGDLGAMSANVSSTLRLSATASAVVTGNVANSQNSHTLRVEGDAVCVLNGEVIGNASGFTAGSVGVANGGFVTINGNVSAGTTGAAITMASTTAKLVLNGEVQASANQPAVNFTAAATDIKVSGTLIANQTTGRLPIAGTHMRLSESEPLEYRFSNYSLDGYRSLYTADSVGGNPAIVDVRSGTTFGPADELTGTLVVPDPQYVNAGVPVDDTVGTLTAGGLDASALHAALDNYAGKDGWKANVSGLASQGSVDTIDGIVDSILEDTSDLQANQGNWLTATGFSTHSASDVWSNGTRTLTSFGSLVTDVTAAVWSAGTRTLTAISDSAGVTTLLQRILGIIRTASGDATAETAQTTAIRNGLATEQNVTDAAQSVIDHGDGDGGWGDVGAGGGVAGEGATEWDDLTVNVDGAPAGDVAVWVTTDVEGDNVVAGTVFTNSFGRLTNPFMLDAGGTYYVWLRKTGANFVNPATIQVPA